MTYRILIVDDDSSTRNLLKIYLSQWGYDCTLAVDGSHAWERFKETPFDIVLTDWLMPGIQGPELCKRIRNFNKGTYTYIILCTVKDNVKHIVEGMESGADDYVTKPFDRNELKVRLNAGERILCLEQSLEQTNVRLQRNLKQAALSLETMLPLRRQGPPLNVEWFFKPAVYIGGDLFNVVSLDEDRTSIFSIDVSGHGVASALFAVTLNNMLRPWMSSSEAKKGRIKFGTEDLTSPAMVASALNDRFQLQPPTDLYFTMFYSVFEHSTNTLRWVRAGHPSPILIKGEQLTVLEKGDPPIGFVPDYKFTEYRSKLEIGDKLFLYTDGLTEAESPESRPFGMERLKSKLASAANAPLKTTINKLKKTIFEFRQNDDFDDDISLLGIELTGDSK